jgi:hypothetical protein
MSNETLENIIDNYAIESIIKKARMIDLKGQNSYLKTYPYFVNYFKEIDNLEVKDVVIGISFTYSWMPKILTIHEGNLEEIRDILNNIKNNSFPLQVSDLSKLKYMFNHSLVGTSKLLHFINPNKYAIWDSNIYKFFKNTKYANQDKLHSETIYLKYLELLERLAKHPEFQEINDGILSKIRKDMFLNDYHMTKLRVAELILFSIGKQLNKSSDDEYDL